MPIPAMLSLEQMESSIIVMDAAEPKKNYETKDQKKNRDGVPGWTLPVVLRESILVVHAFSVTIWSASMPVCAANDVVRLVGGQVGSFATANGKSSALFVQATGVEVIGKFDETTGDIKWSGYEAA